MTPMSDSQIEQRVAQVFGGNHVPPRDMDKSELTEAEAPVQDEEIENEVVDNPEELPAPDDADLSEAARKEEAADRLRQADYTRKTMALAQERRAIEAERAEMAELREFRDQLAANPALQQDVVAAWQRHQAQQGETVSTDSVALRQVVARLNAMEQETVAIREDRFVSRLDAEQRAVAQEFGMTVEEVQTHTAELIKADKLGFSTPPDAINDILAGRVARVRHKTARVEGQKDLVKQINQGRRAPSVVPSGKTPPKREPSEKDIANMSESQFRQFLRKETTGKG